MELLSAKCADFDLDRGLWKLERNRTKTNSYIEIPLAPQVTLWLEEAIVFACGSEYLFPARRLIRMKNGQPRTNRFEHVSPDTLNVALKRLPLEGIAHFTVHDMRRTARTHLGALGVDPFVAERALNHKVSGTQGIYDRHDYLPQRRQALHLWAHTIGAISKGEPVDFTCDTAWNNADQEGAVAYATGRLPTALVAKRAANE